MISSNTTHPFVDTVCRIKVTKGDKVPVFVFQSETYHFCADACRNAFIANPEKYVKSKPSKKKGLWNRYLERLDKITGGKPPCCH